MGISVFSGRSADIPLDLLVVDYAARTISVRAAFRWLTNLTSCTVSVIPTLASALRDRFDKSCQVVEWRFEVTDEN